MRQVFKVKYVLCDTRSENIAVPKESIIKMIYVDETYLMTPKWGLATIKAEKLMTVDDDLCKMCKTVYEHIVISEMEYLMDETIKESFKR